MHINDLHNLRLMQLTDEEWLTELLRVNSGKRGFIRNPDNGMLLQTDGAWRATQAQAHLFDFDRDGVCDQLKAVYEKFGVRWEFKHA